MKSSAKTISQMPGYFMAFQNYDRWSAEEMKNLLCLGLLMEVRGLAFRNTSGWLVVSESTMQIHGASMVNG